MANPLRRSTERLPCDIPAEIRSSMGKSRLCEGRIVNIGLGGFQFRCRAALEWKVPYQLVFGWEGRSADLDCRVVREGPRDEPHPTEHVYGIEFNASSSQEHRLRLIIAELKTKGKRR